MGQGKVRVAILGGGVGAMTAAFALTEIDKAGENYEITVHQLGWRLGATTFFRRLRTKARRRRFTA